MLSNITWWEFFMGVGIVMVIYYLYVALRFYPQELKRIFSSGKGGTKSESAFVEQFVQQEEHLVEEVMQDDGEDEFNDVEVLISSLSKTIEKGSKKKMMVGEFKQSLRMVLREHLAIMDTPFRASINELIVSECEKYGAFTLSEKEVDAMWSGI